MTLRAQTSLGYLKI